MSALFSPVSFARGRAMKNAVALSPLTNQQSHADGVLSDEEFRWLTMRAEGGFGLVMTCAAHVQAIGQGFVGQLGVWDDRHLPGLTRLASAIKAQGALAWIQLHHAGNRAPADLIGTAPVCPSDHAETGARALTGDEVEQLAEDFVAGAVRAARAGFDGAELHGAHGYSLAQFLSPEINQRDDQWGGSAENRARLLHTIIAGVRARCGPSFQLGLRISPERFGLRLDEMIALARDLLSGGALDLLDLSLWNFAKEPDDDRYKGRTLASYFTELPRQQTRLFAAGKIASVVDARAAMALGLDGVMIGRGAILHHDWPLRAQADPDFAPVGTPVTGAYLEREGLSPIFVEYMRRWKDFVAA